MRYVLVFIAFIFFTACEIDHNRPGANMDQAAFDVKLQEVAKKGKYPSIGEQILNARTLKGISEDELAKAVGLSKNNIISIEKNRVVPTREVITDLQSVLESEIIIDANK